MLQQKRKGFTLIELLIVVVIIGILAAIAIPKFASTKEKAYIAAMKSDLRNIATVQEGWFADNMLYTNMSASNVGGSPTADTNTDFVPSVGVTISATATAGTGWSATASHSGTGQTCQIYYGSAATAAGVPDGEPQCSTPAGS
jgi:type IV pilus assembly protein PilA